MHLGQAGQRAVSQFLDGLRSGAADRIRSVMLFGSRARGDARPGSDVDLFVVVDRRDGALLDLVYGLAQDVLLGERVLLCPKVCPAGKLALMRQVGDPLLRSLERDGQELWTRS
jgi:predicted nucleotidyltransferase